MQVAINIYTLLYILVVPLYVCMYVYMYVSCMHAMRSEIGIY